jgi:MFS transporter, PAT family, beta-lactamase induction signal transducer AmpG
MHETELPEAAGALAPPLEDSIVKAERPWLFGLLVAPNAVLVTGIVQGGVLAYLMRQHGVSGLRSSQIISLLGLPTTIYFLWSPITDFLVRRRTWLMIGAAVGAALMSAAFAQPDLASPRTVVLMFLSVCIGQLVVSACGGMMGALRSERSRRMASSFYQGGALGFAALAVFLLIMVSDHARPELVGIVAGVIVAVPGLLALFAPKQEVSGEASFGKTMERIWGEFKSTFLRWEALPYTITLLFPLTTGSAMGLLPGIARDYGVNGDHVAWMNGVAGAMLLAAGSLAASLIPARIRASVAYCAVGLVNAVTCAVLWLGPLSPSTYFVGVTLYLFTVGAGYATFTAVVLEFLGHSGKSGSGRYSIINSLGNVPVVYMTALDGIGGNRWGARGLSGTEAVAGGVGAAIMLAYFLTRRGAKAGNAGATG